MSETEQQAATNAAPVAGQSPVAAGTESGVTLVTAWGSIVSQTDVSAADIQKYRTNVYANGVVRRQRYLIFTQAPIINVLDPEGEPHDELRDRIEEMTRWGEVDLYSKMVLAWSEIMWYGAAFFNPVWERDGSELVLRKLRHLPSESFTAPPQGAQEIYSSVLPGVTIEDGEIAFYQLRSLSDLAPVRLENVTMITEPTSQGLAGSPIMAPLVPIFNMINFGWTAQMQRTNRVGAPIVFIRVTNGTAGDIAYAKKVLANWGKNTSFVLRDNMEVVKLDFNDSTTAMDVIRELNQLLIEFFSPASSLSKEGALIGGSDWGAAELVKSYVEGVHNWLEAPFQKILQYYLEANGYEGYRVTIQLPTPSIDRANIMLQQAVAGAQTRTLSINEVRKRLEAEEVDDAGLAEIAAQWDAFVPQQPMWAPALGCGGEQFNAYTLPKPKKSEKAVKRDLAQDVDALEGDLLDALKELP
jgi:hypothetical protein